MCYKIYLLVDVVHLKKKKKKILKKQFKIDIWNYLCGGTYWAQTTYHPLCGLEIPVIFQIMTSLLNLLSLNLIFFFLSFAFFSCHGEYAYIYFICIVFCVRDRFRFTCLWSTTFRLRGLCMLGTCLLLALANIFLSESQDL